MWNLGIFKPSSSQVASSVDHTFARCPERPCLLSLCTWQPHLRSISLDSHRNVLTIWNNVFFQDSVKVKNKVKQIRQSIRWTLHIHNLLLLLAKLKRKDRWLEWIERFTRGQQQEPTCVECQYTHEEAFLHGSSLQQKPSHLPLWDFPPRLQLCSLISPKMQMSNHICHIFRWFIVGGVGGAKAGISPATSNSKAICCFVM